MLKRIRVASLRKRPWRGRRGANSWLVRVTCLVPTGSNGRFPEGESTPCMIGTCAYLPSFLPLNSSLAPPSHFFLLSAPSTQSLFVSLSLLPLLPLSLCLCLGSLFLILCFPVPQERYKTYFVLQETENKNLKSIGK